MPTTQCHCNACGHDFALLTFKGDDTAPVCPRCKSKDIQATGDQVRFLDGPGLGGRIAGIPKGPS